MELSELIKKSRSVRSFEEDGLLNYEKILEILDVARLIPSACNYQPLKYKIIASKSGVDLMLSKVNIAGGIPDVLPPEGNYPSAFIIICHDENVTPQSVMGDYNVGIAAQTINLLAMEKGFGSCMIGAYSRKEIAKTFALPRNLVPMLIMMLGTPKDKPEIVSLPENGDTMYYRNEKGHFVPKRSLDDIIIK